MIAKEDFTTKRIRTAKYNWYEKEEETNKKVQQNYNYGNASAWTTTDTTLIIFKTNRGL